MLTPETEVPVTAVRATARAGAGCPDAAELAAEDPPKQKAEAALAANTVVILEDQSDVN